jgi:sugar lactone lactonase YvrE
VSEVEVFDSRRCELGEGPHYDERTGRVWWVDVLGRRVLWRTPSAGESGWLTTPGHVGAAVPTSSGRLVVCLPEGPSLLDPVDGRMRPLARYPDAAPSVRSNDAKADRDGRLWLGTMAYDEASPIARLYRLDAGAAQLLPVIDEVTVSNGLGWSPDGTLSTRDHPRNGGRLRLRGGLKSRAPSRLPTRLPRACRRQRRVWSRSGSAGRCTVPTAPSTASGARRS